METVKTEEEALVADKTVEANLVVETNLAVEANSAEVNLVADKTAEVNLAVANSVVGSDPAECRCERRPVVASVAAIVRSVTLIGLLRRQVAINASTASRQDTVNHVPVDVSKAKIAALIPVGKLLVV